MKKRVFRALTMATAAVALFLSAAFSDVVSAAAAAESGNNVTNPSPGTFEPGIVAPVEELPGGWALGPITQEGYANAKAAAESEEARQKIEEMMPGWTFDCVVDVWNFGTYQADAEDGVVKVKMPALPDKENYTYTLLHYPTVDWSDIKGSPDVIVFQLMDWANNYWGFRVAGGSPVVFVRLVKASEPEEPGETEEPDWYTEGAVEVADQLPEGIQQNPITREAHDLGVAAGKSDNAKHQVEEKLPGWTIDGIVSVFDLAVEKAGQVAVKMPALADRDSYTYVALHYSDWGFSGYPEVIKMTLADWAANKWTFDVTSGSPYVFVRVRKAAATNPGNNQGQTEQPAVQAPASQPAAAQVPPVSPKTGEAQPMATGIVLVCLAGAAVCMRRVRRKS